MATATGMVTATVMEMAMEMEMEVEVETATETTRETMATQMPTLSQWTMEMVRMISLIAMKSMDNQLPVLMIQARARIMVMVNG